jgi:hypothetical protein
LLPLRNDTNKKRQIDWNKDKIETITILNENGEKITEVIGTREFVLQVITDMAKGYGNLRVSDENSLDK